MIKKKNLKVLAVTTALAISQAMTAFAGEWKQDSTGWWYQNDNSTYKANEWFQDTDGSWYYLNGNGYTATSCWQQLNGAWYYFDASGRMLANKWEWIDANKDGTAECYGFSPSGAAYMGVTTPDGYAVDASGAWTVGGIPQTKKVSVGPGGTATKTTTASFSGGGSGGSGGGGGSSSGGSSSGGSSYVDKNWSDYSDNTSGYVNDFENGNRSLMSASQWKEVKSAIEDFKDNYNIDNMSDFEKEITIIQWLVENCAYNKKTTNCATAYGCILEGQAKCAGYADAFLQTAKLCGLDVRYVYNSTHAWNLVKLDGDWYHVDVTWEDPIGSNEYGFNNLRCEYINLTDAEIKKEKSSHASWSPSTIKATGTEYGKTYVTNYMNEKKSASDKEAFFNELPRFYEEVKNLDADYILKTDESNYEEELTTVFNDIKSKGTGTYAIVMYSQYYDSTAKDYVSMLDKCRNILGYKNYKSDSCASDYKVTKPTAYTENGKSYHVGFSATKITYTNPDDSVTSQTAINMVNTEEIINNSTISNDETKNTEIANENTTANENMAENTENSVTENTEENNTNSEDINSENTSKATENTEETEN